MNAKTVPATAAALIATAAPAFAAGARQDHSGILVWAFLGMCALIVVAQVIPALMMATGLVRGLFGRKTEDAAAK